MCLMGDPGVAKSQLLKHIATVAPRAVRRYPGLLRPAGRAALLHAPPPSVGRSTRRARAARWVLHASCSPGESSSVASQGPLALKRGWALHGALTLLGPLKL